MQEQKTGLMMQRLLAYARPYWGRIVISLACSLGVASADIASARLIQPLVDLIIVDKNYGLVNLVPLFIVGIALFKGLSRFFQEYYIRTAGQLVVQDIRNDLFQHALRLSMRFHSRNKGGNLMSRILNDVTYMQRSAADILVDSLRESFTMVGLVGLAFYTDWKMAAVAFVVLPITVVPAAAIGRRIRVHTKRGQGSVGELTSVLQEAVGGIKVIKAFGREDQENRKFRDENWRYYKLLRKVLKYEALSSPFVELIASFGVAAVFWYGINRVLSGAISQGELFSFSAAILMMFVPLKRLIRVNNVFQKSMGAAERVFEIMDEPVDISNRPGATELGRASGLIEFDKVTFAYDEDPVLLDFCLRAHPGEKIALVGPSGAGKTTVAGLVSRFYDPQQGAVRIDGHDLRELSLQSIARNTALVDQETFLFNDTIYENIRYGRPDATAEDVCRAAEQAYAAAFIEALPEGYQSRIGDRGGRLSGGQRQRICIARAILSDAPILILDEATSALDTESEAMVQKALANLMANRTTLVIAHRLSTVLTADRIVVMEQGRIVQQGSHEQLLQEGGLYRKLYNMQFQEP
ncbi:MAG: ABC transporter transmembrane domain-containing protein [Desulfuromonadales bacterium]|nr:ABC transporter transmembrane domain-containing protein [Desulfuromonadales bacterium]